MSGASGAVEATAAEKALFDRNGSVAPRGFATLTGHMKEAQFPFAVALAALAVARKSGYPPFDPRNERRYGGTPEAVLATAVGYNLFEGMALVAAAD